MEKRKHTRMKLAELLENTRSLSVTADLRLDAVPAPVESEIPPAPRPDPVEEPLM
jgi:hypothetical protein